MIKTTKATYKSTKWEIGGRVRFIEDGVFGTITDVGYCAIQVKWDDGQSGGIAREDYDLIEHVTRR